MWFLTWKKYSYSKFGTVVSFIGAITRYCGAMFVFNGLVVPGIVGILIGIGIHFCAEAINKAAVKKYK